MKNEIQTIITSLQETLNGHPWFGRAVYEILQEVDETKVYNHPNEGHSLIDLLYHMVTWAEFTQKRLEKEKIADMDAFDAMDWRQIDPVINTWKKGLTALKASHQKIIELLQSKDDAFLEEKVDYREYDFRYLLYGLVQHNIYHLGQIAYANKFMI